MKPRKHLLGVDGHVTAFHAALVAIAAMVLFAGVGAAQADVVLGTSVATVDAYGPGGPVGEVDFSPGFAADSGIGPYYYPWGRWKASGSGIGIDVPAPTGTQDFAAAVDLLTNGGDDFVGLFCEAAGGFYQWTGESLALSGPGVTGPDFQGNTITAMVYRQTEWLSESGHTHFAYQITYYGIPEPGTLGLAGLGGIALMARKRRRTA